MSKKQEMDPRCPLKLTEHPTSFCPLAVMRLKALRGIGEEITEEEEQNLPGCNWAIQHQGSSYCFFKYMKQHAGQPTSDIEVAHMNSISVETVKAIQKEALEQVKASGVFDEDDNE